MPSIVSIAGNRRPDNYTALALALVNAALEERGAKLTVFDGREIDMAFPGEPETADAGRMREAILAADGVVLATPEYHGTFSAYTKLIIENSGYPSVLQGKPMALLGVASGRIGAIKSTEQLRGTCAHNGAIVMPFAVSIASVRKVFEQDGTCNDPGVAKVLAELADNLLSFLTCWRPPA